MGSENKIYHHSPGKIALMSFGVLVLGFFTFTIGKDNYFFILLFLYTLVGTLFFAGSKIEVSNKEIKASHLFISRSLKWSEVARVSECGQSLRLHNKDGNITVFLDSQLAGYVDVLDILFSENPALFDIDGDISLQRGLMNSVFNVSFGLVMMAIAVFIFIQVPLFAMAIIALVFGLIGLFFVGEWILSPQGLFIGPRTLSCLYLFKEETYEAGEIKSISLERQRTRNGYIYFVQICLKGSKLIKLSGIGQGSALLYQTLKRWHTRAISRKSSIL